jgi:hypothetical protein
VQAVQVPLISTAAFAFRFQAGPQALVGEWGGREVAYVGFRTDYTLLFPPVSEPPGLVINLAALFGVVWLAVGGWREWKRDRERRESIVQAAAQVERQDSAVIGP